jgi:hypothetical protein
MARCARIAARSREIARGCRKREAHAVQALCRENEATMRERTPRRAQKQARSATRGFNARVRAQRNAVYARRAPLMSVMPPDMLLKEARLLDHVRGTFEYHAARRHFRCRHADAIIFS